MSAVMSIEMLAWIKGLAMSAGLIMAIGAQNAFVLTQGLKQEYHWPVAGLCILFDVILISAGVAGFGVLISESDTLLEIARWGGTLFLLAYGAFALQRALSRNALRADTGARSLRNALLTTVAVTLLNPHAYIDTVVLLGSVGGQYDFDQRIWFAAGAITFSAIWFCSLTAGARWLKPLFSRPIAWKVLDFLVCIMMWTIAISLLRMQ